MTTFIYTTVLVISTYLTLSGLYQFIIALASKRKGKATSQFDDRLRRFLVLVPAYQADEVIIHSTRRNMSLKYEYPRAMFDYVVISDGLKPETNATLKSLGVKVHPVAFQKSTKVKSLQSAINHYQGDYDGVVILDADNTVQMNLLFKANHYLGQGFKAIQGLRKAANRETSIALMDGLSEAANTEMLCKGANRLGLSSKLSGSGMVFDYALFKSLVHQLTAIGGFDKELELMLTKQEIYIRYAEDLVVYDEKVSHTQAFAKQRGRWLQAQYSFFLKSLGSALESFYQGKMDHFHKVMQLALPPRVLAPFVLVVICGISALMGYMLPGVLSAIALACTLGAYVLVLPFKFLLTGMPEILKSIPRLVTGALMAMVWMKRSRHSFLHTEHKLANS